MNNEPNDKASKACKPSLGRLSPTAKKYIEGYFAVFGSNYELWTGASESIDPHAFDGALVDDVRALIDHETRLVLGRNKAGTLELKVDERGLWGSSLTSLILMP